MAPHTFQTANQTMFFIINKYCLSITINKSPRRESGINHNQQVVQGPTVAFFYNLGWLSLTFKRQVTLILSYNLKCRRFLRKIFQFLILFGCKMQPLEPFCQSVCLSEAVNNL